MAAGAARELVSAKEANGGADADIAEITRAEVDQIVAGLAARCWPPEAARLPWVARAYPQ